MGLKTGSSADPAHSVLAPGRPQFVPFIALCSSSAHQLLDLLSVQVSVLSSLLPVTIDRPAPFAVSYFMPGCRPGKGTKQAVWR
jgi:hypothetical protein